MMEIGRFNSLKINALDDRGAWLESKLGPILLPRRDCPTDLQTGQVLRVFVYRDSTGSLVASRRSPLAEVGEFAVMPVRQVCRYGAFLDWGLGKDLLVPFSEQEEKMQEGRSYLVKVCRDRNDRVYGTSRIEACLQREVNDLEPGQEVDLLIWDLTDLGAKVIVNERYQGLVYHDQLGSTLRPGDRLRGYIDRIRDDQKIDVSLRQGGVAGVDAAKNVILKALAENGFLPLHDKSSPDAIQQRLGLSKKLFKKAVGGLYKEGRIELDGSGIRSVRP